MAFMRIEEQAEPDTPPSGKATLFIDEADKELAVKKDNGTVQKFSGGGGVTDHGALTGLNDDDHPQYHTDARAATWLAGRTFVSAPQTITAGGPLTIPHGLGSTPVVWYVILENVTPEHGFTTGQRILPFNNRSKVQNNQGTRITADATDLNVVYGAGQGGSPSPYTVLDASGSEQKATTANWNAIFVAKLDY